MKKDVDFTKMYKAAEVKLTYVSKERTSHRIPIKSADDAACLFFMVWDITTIEHIEEVKMILLNRANRVLGVVHLSKGGLSCNMQLRPMLVLLYWHIITQVGIWSRVLQIRTLHRG